MSFTRYESLAGRTVIVTGGASGIGAAFVRAFAENGARVAFLDLQEEAGAALASELGQMFVQCDLTDISALRAALDTVRPSPRIRSVVATASTVGFSAGVKSGRDRKECATRCLRREL